MISADFLETMISHNPKEVFLKFELLKYDVDTKQFELYDEVVVEQRNLPNGISTISGGIDINVEQDVRTTLDIEITNTDGMNNWGSDFDPEETDEFKWWLDKRMNLDIGMRLDSNSEIEFIRMGHFIITHFKTNHNLTALPTIQIQGSSKEVLYASRRGKFLFPTSIRRGAVMTDTIRTILKKKDSELFNEITGGEETDSNIFIDPQINTTSLKIEDGEKLDLWSIVNSNVTMELDTDDKAHGDSSLRFDVSNRLPNWTVVAEKEWIYPVDLSRINAMALWTRCSKDIPEGGISILLIDESGEERDLPLRELAGHVVEGGEVVHIDNWRNVILPIVDFDVLTRVKKMQVRINTSRIETPFSFWIDQVYCAEIRNMLPHDLNYGAGQNKWSAIMELANLLDCNAYFNEWGQFMLEKRKFPKERFDGNFQYDAYEVLQPVITYRDTDKMNNLYAGGEDLFEEHELSNHIHVIGGSTTSSVMSMADMTLHTDGLHIREKGKVLNGRGKIRAIDQFHSTSSPTILNGDSNVEEVYKGHQNLEAVVEEYPNGFPHLALPPISNFAVERIGDFIYHHNHANPDPLIVYAYEAKNRALWELRQKLAYSEQLNILSAPYYILRGHDIIRIEDSLLGLDDNFQIKSINIPLSGDYMSISATKVRNLIIDIPYFDISPLKANACWYGYDGNSLTFTYPL